MVGGRKVRFYLSFREEGSRIYRQEIGAATPEQIPGVRSSPNILRLNPEGTELLYSAERPDSAEAQNGAAKQSTTSAAQNGPKAEDSAAPFDARRVGLMRTPTG